MGILSDFKGLINVQKIKSGGTAKLSIAQITGLIVNMPDAQRKLSKEEFDGVYTLYKELRKCKTKMQMDMAGYTETAVKIIKMFDEYAPYEKYSGGNELEFSFLMDDIRSEDKDDFSLKNEMSEEEKEYIKYLVEQGTLDEEDAEKALMIMKCYYDCGKKKALELFDAVANDMIEKYGPFTSLLKVSFLSGIMVPNGVLSKEESDELSEKYAKLGLEIINKKTEP